MKPKEHYLKKLQKHARRVMKQRKFKQKDLARHTGLTDSDISRICNGSDVRYSKGATIMELDAE